MEAQTCWHRLTKDIQTVHKLIHKNKLITVEIIILFRSHNFITNITDSFTKWNLLEVLDLSFNKIRIISNFTFYTLKDLRKL